MRNHWIKKQEPHYVYGDVLDLHGEDPAILLMKKHVGDFSFRHAYNQKCSVSAWIGLTLYDYSLKEELLQKVNNTSSISFECRKNATPLSNIEIFVDPNDDDKTYQYCLSNPSMQAYQLSYGMTAVVIYYDWADIYRI